MGTGTFFGKYSGTTTNNMKDSTPLANINFSIVSEPNILTQITKTKQFKPKEDIKGVCTSLEDWVLHIPYPNETLQMNKLYDNDSETAQHLDRVISSQHERSQKMFNITTTVFPSAKDNIDSNTENKNLKGLDTNTNRNDGLSSQQLALMVNKVLIESLEKAAKQKKMAKKHSLKDIKNMKKTFNAASAFTTIMSNMLDKSNGYKDFEEMNQDILHQVNTTTEENPTVENKEKSSNSNSSGEEDPPPKKITSLLSVHKTH